MSSVGVRRGGSVAAQLPPSEGADSGSPGVPGSSAGRQRSSRPSGRERPSYRPQEQQQQQQADNPIAARARAANGPPLASVDHDHYQQQQQQQPRGPRPGSRRGGFGGSKPRSRGRFPSPQQPFYQHDPSDETASLRLPLEFQDEPAFAGAAIGSALEDEDPDSPQCVLCCQTIRCWVAAGCSHGADLCGQCLLRMHQTRERAFLRARARNPEAPEPPPLGCPMCKVTWPVVVVTDRRADLPRIHRQCIEQQQAAQSGNNRHSLKLDGRPLTFDPELQVWFVDRLLKERFRIMRSLRCLICSQQSQDDQEAAEPAEGGAESKSRAGQLFENCRRFKSFDRLNDHMRKDHSLTYCPACFETLDLFLHERELYSRAQLRWHCKHGAPASDLSPQVDPHPFCSFCEVPLFSADELYVHLNTRHTRCVLCHRMGRTDEYIRNDGALQRHLEHSHYICHHPNCQVLFRAGQYESVSFLSQLDLTLHDAKAHNAPSGRNRGRAVLPMQPGSKDDLVNRGIPARDLIQFLGFDYYEQLAEGLAQQHRGQAPAVAREHGEAAVLAAAAAAASRSVLPSVAGHDHEDHNAGLGAMNSIRARAMAANLHHQEDRREIQLRDQEERRRLAEAEEQLRRLQLAEEDFPSLGLVAGGGAAGVEDSAVIGGGIMDADGDHLDDHGRRREQFPGLPRLSPEAAATAAAAAAAAPSPSGPSAARVGAAPRASEQGVPVAYRNTRLTGIANAGEEAFPSLPAVAPASEAARKPASSSGSLASAVGKKKSAVAAVPKRAAFQLHASRFETLDSKAERARKEAERKQQEQERLQKQLMEQQQQRRKQQREERLADGMGGSADLATASQGRLSNPELGLTSAGFEGSSKIRSAAELPPELLPAAARPVAKQAKPQEIPSDFLFPSLTSGPTPASQAEPVWVRGNGGGAGGSKKKQQQPKAQSKPKAAIAEPVVAAAAAAAPVVAPGVQLAAPPTLQQLRGHQESMARLAQAEFPTRFVEIVNTLLMLMDSLWEALQERTAGAGILLDLHLSYETHRHLQKEARRSRLRTLLDPSPLGRFGLRPDRLPGLAQSLTTIGTRRGEEEDLKLRERAKAIWAALDDSELSLVWYWMHALAAFHIRGGDADGLKELRRVEAQQARDLEARRLRELQLQQKQQLREDGDDDEDDDEQGILGSGSGSQGGKKQNKKSKANKADKVLFRFGGR